MALHAQMHECQNAHTYALIDGQLRASFIKSVAGHLKLHEQKKQANLGGYTILVMIMTNMSY